ncbi:MAG: proline iminopeptidase-family hydrolase [Leptolyngbyaceae cyanobacterium MO_188.B28]|nr:proline iminopeptidase-family hydrolase [Leptolyngbyaceae cyanobacterium MO_188.B28]
MTGIQETQAAVAAPCPTCADLAYEREGMIEVTGGKVWYGIYGKGNKPPILTLHGGPGVSHYYLSPFFKEFSDVTERPIIFYDQLGCGRSERPSIPSLWTVEKFRDRLSQVVAALSLTEFHLWGHSWGTTLALAYAAIQPEGLLSVAFNSPVFDLPAYRADLQNLLKTLPQDIQDSIKHNPPDSEPYLEALSTFYRHFLHTADPWPDCFLKAFAGDQFGFESYRTTVGTDELNYTGNLTDRNDSRLLLEITAHIWFVCGQNDITRPDRCLEYQKRVANSQVTIFQNSSHCYFDEERTEYMLALCNFVQKHDSHMLRDELKNSSD